MGLIVYSCPYVPPELISASGLKPYRVMPLSSNVPGPVDVTAGVCPYMRSFLNTAGTMKDVSAIILTTVCDQMRRGRDFVEQGTSIKSFLLNVPSTWQSREGAGLYVSELKRLGRFLETIGGEIPGADNLWRVMVEYDLKRKTLRELKGRIKARDYSMAIAEFGRTGEIRYSANGLAPIAFGIPVALIGGPLTEQDFYLFDLIESNGGNLVLDGTETGERTMPSSPDHRGVGKLDPFEQLAESYFCHIPDVFRRPNSELYKWLKRVIESNGIRGVVLVRHAWCDKWHAEMPGIKEWLNVPMLDMDVDGESSSMGRNAGRIQSFMETIS